MVRKKILVTLAAVLIFYFVTMVFSSCSKFKLEEKKIKIIDQADREVYIPAKVERIASLWPEATRIIIALGKGEQIVGIDSMKKKILFLQKSSPS